MPCFSQKLLCCASFQRFLDGLSVSRNFRRSCSEMGSTWCSNMRISYIAPTSACHHSNWTHDVYGFIHLNIFDFFISDINECINNTHSCYANTTCQNTIGSHYCACMSGYTGNGQNCIGKIVALCFLVVQFGSLNKNTGSYALRATNPAINLKPMPLICWLELLQNYSSEITKKNIHKLRHQNEKRILKLNFD